jgi:DNA-binding response OmpR family regulator
MTNGRLLIVDDEPEFGEYVGRVGERIGLSVRVTTNAKTFKETFQSFDPTVIVMDIVMPEVDGIELIEWLSENECTAKVILVTGFNPHYADATQKLGEARGMMSVTTLTKPVSLADLKAALTPS